MVSQPASFRMHLTNTFSPEQHRTGAVTRSPEWIAKSHYNDDTARSLGYKRATVPGGVGGRVVLAMADEWGQALFERGETYSRRRQPLYADEDVDVVFSPIRDEDGAFRVNYEVINAEGVACVVGWFALHHSPPVPPPLSEFPFTDWRAVPMRVMDSDQFIGEQLATEVLNDPRGPSGASPSVEYTYAATATDGFRLRTIPETLLAAYPELPKNGLVPWGFWGGSKRPDLDYDGSNVVANTESISQFFKIPTLDDRLVMHMRISNAFERKGSKYFEQETYVVANDRTPITWGKSTSLIFRAAPQRT